MVFTGRRLNGGFLRGVLDRINMNGVPISFREDFDVSGASPGWISFSDVRQTSDGVVIVGTFAAASTAPNSTVLLTTDIHGHVMWVEVFNPPPVATESTGEALDILPGGDIVFVSRLLANGTPIGSQFVRTTGLGAPIWYRSYLEFIAAHAALRFDSC